MSVDTSAKESLCAADVMCREVITIPCRASLRDAVTTMTQNRVSGLPVVNDDNRAIGVITATDILSFDDEFSLGLEGRNRIVGSYFDPVSLEWDMVRMLGDSPAFDAVTVREEMSDKLVSVSPETDLRTVAELMLSTEVHRVLVLDEYQFVRGVISAMDFLGVFATRESF